MYLRVPNAATAAAAMSCVIFVFRLGRYKSRNGHIGRTIRTIATVV